MKNGNGSRGTTGADPTAKAEVKRWSAARKKEVWGTGGITIEIVDEGWVCVFSAVNRYDAYCVGIHAVKTGNRFAALQPIAQGLQRQFGATGATAGAVSPWSWTMALNPLRTIS